MSILNVSTPINFPFPTSCHSKTLNRKLSFNPNKPTSEFHRRNPFSLYLWSSTTTKFQTLAHFGRPTNRRNSLRKKLLHDHHQVRPNQVLTDPPPSEIPNPSSSFSNSVEESDKGILGVPIVDSVVENFEVEKPKSKLLGESVLLNKLENWVDQLKKDIEFWGIGSGPIFTVYQDSFGGVKRVSVDEEEILRRSRVQREVVEDFQEVSDKILEANKLARDMENGNTNVIPRNSSVAKFVVQGEEEGGFVKVIQGFVTQPGLLPKLSRIGSKVLCVLVVLWAVKKMFTFGDKEVQYTEMEKEMMRRKIKARREKEMLVKGAVEVVPQPLNSPVMDLKKPKLDKEQLKNSILKAKASSDKLVVHDSSAKVATRSMDMDHRVQEIREMARRARKSEGRDKALVSRDKEMDDPVIEESSNEVEVIKKNCIQDESLSNHQNEVGRKTMDSNAILRTTSVDVAASIDNSVLHEVVPADECNSRVSDAIVPGDREINKQETEFTESTFKLKDREANQASDVPNESSVNKKPRIIRSVKEARHYLSKKHDGQGTGSKIELVSKTIADLGSSGEIGFTGQEYQTLEIDTILSRSDAPNEISDLKPVIKSSADSNQKEKALDSRKKGYSKDSDAEHEVGDLQVSKIAEVNDIRAETGLSGKTENWLERNFHEVERTQLRSDALNGISESNPVTNPIEDSNKNGKELGGTKDDYFKGSGVEPVVGDLQKSETTLDHGVNGISTETPQSRKTENWLEKKLIEVEPLIKQTRSDALNGISESKPFISPTEDSNRKDEELDPSNDDYFKGSGVEPGVGDPQKSETTLDREIDDISTETRRLGKTENWLEKNFHEVEPIIKKIRAGFTDNYKVAKERVAQPLDIPTEMESLGFVEDGGEYDWMQDDHLKDIVFRVRENELSGRDPFYSMSAEDKEAFFGGLEKKAEKENKKLSHLHEWLHSNIENLDYGADGISIYDPPEKIIPRWKGPPAEKIPEFLNEFLEQRKTSSTKNITTMKQDESGVAEKPVASSSPEKADGSNARIKKLKNPKTVIEGSDGSVKAGKKFGKEYWQHTKKWSQGFLDSYNAETDPEIKSVMKDIGKDLDRWITEKEIQEATDLINKLPDKSIMQKKLDKLKREMELFGPQAVVSKYREYADDKEEDYLWWLDLSHILCIELYTIDDGKERVGLYSLEMAEDLELEPKPNHVIAFQDAGDCKNLCYIIQAHLEMLGNGHAFVVARPPKDAFREAKSNGFGVTVIKKGELQLNIDQPLEEVEEQIIEIGSKIYHDMMMKERSVDINSIMKGVFGFSDRTTKRLRRRLMKQKKK